MSASFEDHPRRSCGGCFYWNEFNRCSDKGYVESLCLLDKDDRNHQLKRAADVCSKWKPKGGLK